MADKKTYTYDEWIKEGERLFGKRWRNWKFLCPGCGTVQCGQDFLAAGIDEKEIRENIAYNCIGRLVDGKGCDWSLGGLFKLHTVEVVKDGKPQPCFAFAKTEQP